MLAAPAAARPAVGALTASAFFSDDVLLRALRFLDTILQRDHAQKACSEVKRSVCRRGCLPDRAFLWQPVRGCDLREFEWMKLECLSC
jgi:hypothetical protein